MKIEIGDIRRFAPQTPGSQDPLRVLLADEQEVMYDVWWNHLREGRGDWGLRRTRSCIYYRIPTRWLIENSEHLGHEPLDNREWARHRPDLPLRLLRKTGWRFDGTTFNTLDEFEDRARTAGLDVDELSDRVALPVARLWLRPLGPHGGQLPTVSVQPSQGGGFRALELLWLAHNAQAPHTREPWEGAGLYRDGLSRGEPSYYIGPDRDLAGHLD